MVRRTVTGFTLIELLVVVVVIGILAAIALPNFIGAQKKAKIAGVKSNMHICQVAAQSYGTDAGGEYPSNSAGLAPYYPTGGNAVGGSAGTYPSNPMTGVQNESLAACNMATVARVLSERQTSSPSNYGGSIGQTAYSAFSSGASAGNPGAANDCFAVTGNDDGSHAVLGSPGHLILANF